MRANSIWWSHLSGERDGRHRHFKTALLWIWHKTGCKSHKCQTAYIYLLACFKDKTLSAKSDARKALCKMLSLLSNGFLLISYKFLSSGKPGSKSSSGKTKFLWGLRIKDVVHQTVLHCCGLSLSIGHSETSVQWKSIKLKMI